MYFFENISIQKLKGLESKRLSLVFLAEQITDIEDNLTKIKSQQFDAPSVQSSTTERDIQLINLLSQKNELEKTLRENTKEVILLNKALQALPERESRVLELCYVQKHKSAIDRLCEELGYERSRIYQIRNDALNIFAKTFYGKADL